MGTCGVCPHLDLGRYSFLRKIPELKVQLPNNWEAHWTKILVWIFLGKRDENSGFYLLATEVLFNFVLVLENI
jgi:hypothetical protein